MAIKDVVNAPSTMAPVTGSVMNLVKEQHNKGNFIKSRGASLLMLPAVVPNAVAHLALGAVKAVVATGMKVIEIAAAAIGFKNLNLNNSAWTSNYTGQQAADHLGKGSLRAVLVLGATVLSVLSPSILIKAADCLGFTSTSTKKPLDVVKDTTKKVLNWCKNKIAVPVKDGAVKVAKGAYNHKGKIVAGAAIVGGVAAWHQGHLEGVGATIAEYTPNCIAQLPCNLPTWPGIKQLQDYFACPVEA
jgi:hypothetical protein